MAAQAGSVGDNHFDFTGHERDVRTGLIYAGARYYTGAKRKSRMGGNPWLGRWLSVDPMVEEYPAWSPYVYGLDNSVMYIDPDDNKIILGSTFVRIANFFGYKTRNLKYIETAVKRLRQSENREKSV